MKGYDYAVISRASEEIKQECRDLAAAHRLIQRAFDETPVWRMFRRQRLFRISKYYVKRSWELLEQAKREEQP
jgi:hypothetical protein